MTTEQIKQTLQIKQTFKSFINKLIEEINKEVEDKIDPESSINYELSPVTKWFNIDIVTSNTKVNYISFIKQYRPCICLRAHLDDSNIDIDEANDRHNFIVDIIENIIKKRGLDEDISIVPADKSNIYTITFIIHNNKLDDILNQVEE